MIPEGILGRVAVAAAATAAGGAEVDDDGGGALVGTAGRVPLSIAASGPVELPDVVVMI